MRPVVIVMAAACPPVLLSGLVAVHRPTEMALPPPWRLANPMPELSFEWHDYTATVRVPSCPAYSAPYPHGWRCSTTYRRGTSVRVVDAQASACGTYLSALTVNGEWISVWTFTNFSWRATRCELLPAHSKPTTEIDPDIWPVAARGFTGWWQCPTIN